MDGSSWGAPVHVKIAAMVDGVVTHGQFGCYTGCTEKEQCRERKESKWSSVFMKGVCVCGRRSPPILVAVRVNPAKKIHIDIVKLWMITHTN